MNVIFKNIMNVKTFAGYVKLSEPIISKYLLYDVTKSFMGKRFIQSTRPMNLNVTEYEKFFDMVSDSTLLLTFKETIVCRILVY